MKVDMHVHTWFSSDSISRPDQIMKRVERAGLDAIGLVDHGTSLAYSRFPKDMAIRGVELCTTSGHLVGLFLDEDVVQREKMLDVGVAVDMIRDAGGIVVAPHPFDINRSFSQIGKWSRVFDCVEVCNSLCKHQRYNSMAQEFALKMDLGVTAGSDAHLPYQVGCAYLEADVNEFEELRKAILNGNVSVFCKTIPIHEIFFTYLISRMQAFTGAFGRPI